ncbi:type VI secretion system baseplate subunit TssK [Robbsia sp. Bb-Pol-6]|uniref:Type VI secretion system baseplate subunit TssK n=1 Tax=Robbsia betulipollinis TaxID=2981849 RepID=A0ABT3ZL26_9BURK|nr:type VI secretion system baseplate subunit TssK [Robbsia betulipollinis]MCY0386970.1 type VI secretion system baseplate subunit TssK [Robbsia betulipollinis]
MRESIPERIEWHEGMLLSPQHFQTLSARLDSLIAWQTLAAAPFSWGVRSVSIDTGLLPAGLLRILALEAILPDGTAVCYDSGNPMHGALEAALLPYADKLAGGSLDVYLTLPTPHTMRHRGAVRRYRSVGGPLVTDEVSEAPPADIPRQLPNLALAIGDVPSVNYSHLRLCSLSRDNEVVRLGRLLPPLLEIARDNVLWQRTAALVAQIRSKAAFVAKQTANPSSRIDDRLAQLELKDRLRSLLTDLPLVEATLRTPRLHPLPLYLALASLLGSLSLLTPGAIPPAPLDYDHGDPLSVFGPLLAHLDAAINEVSQQYREQKFELHGGAFQFDARTTPLPSQLYVGLRGQSEKDLAAWMNGAIIGPASGYPLLRERRILGAPRHRVDDVPALGVRAGSGYLLFSVDIGKEGISPGDALLISHTNEGASAQRPQEIVLFVKG